MPSVSVPNSHRKRHLASVSSLLSLPFPFLQFFPLSPPHILGFPLVLTSSPHSLPFSILETPPSPLLILIRSITRQFTVAWQMLSALSYVTQPENRAESSIPRLHSWRQPRYRRDRYLRCWLYLAQKALWNSNTVTSLLRWRRLQIMENHRCNGNTDSIKSEF